MILYYSILILYYYYSTIYTRSKLFHKNFLWKFLRCMDETFVFK